MGKRGPKPRGDYESKGATLSARITAETRKRLDAAAKASGVSLSQEVESRLRSSLDEQDTFGGPVTSWILESFAGGIQDIESRTGRRWYEDAYTFKECQAFIVSWLNRLRPDGPSAAPKSTGRLAIPGPIPPSKIAVQNRTGMLLLLMAALESKTDVPPLLATEARVLVKRIKLTKKEREEMEGQRQLLASGAMTLTFRGEK